MLRLRGLLAKGIFFEALSQALESANRGAMPRIAPAAAPITLWLNQEEPLEISAVQTGRTSLCKMDGS